MRVPIRQNTARAPVSNTHSTPAPYGGWNARESLADMPEEDAVILRNYFPETEGVRLRRGYVSHATGLTGPVDSLMAYTPPSAAAELYAANNAAIYDVSASGPIGAAVVSGLGSIRFQHTMFGTSGGNFLYIVNGTDAPRHYDGATWATPTLTGTGLTASDLIHINVFRDRLFFVERNTLSFWYLAVGATTGTVTEFRLDGFASLGGFLMAMGTWTRDSGAGLNDLAVFLTSKGQALIYEGTDPASASAWVLIGVFNVGEPIGRRCMMKIGGELVLITRDGFIPISRAIASARTNEQAAISDRIVNAVTTATRSFGNNFGWQPIHYPKGNMALFNIPTKEGVSAEQYVMNTSTNRWCCFVGQDANCWEVFNDDLYYGGTAVVFQADTGDDDDGVNLEGEAKTAFTYLGRRGRQKIGRMVRPIIATTGTVGFALNADVDFEDRQPTSSPTFESGTGALWDVAIWDVAAWGSSPGIQKDWQSIDGVGYAFALHLKSATQGLELEWYSNDWIFETGGYL